MGDPVTGTIAAVAMVAGTAMSANAAHEAGKANQRLHHFNQEVGKIQANQIIQGGEEQAAVQDIRGKIIQDKQRAGFAGQGVVANAGTAAAVEASSAAVSEQDKLMLKLNARRAAFGARVGAENEQIQGTLARQQGDTQAVGSIISGVGSASMLAGQSGAFSGGGRIPMSSAGSPSDIRFS